jgi:hypothetical protein
MSHYQGRARRQVEEYLPLILSNPVKFYEFLELPPNPAALSTVIDRLPNFLTHRHDKGFNIRGPKREKVLAMLDYIMQIQESANHERPRLISNLERISGEYGIGEYAAVLLAAHGEASEVAYLREADAFNYGLMFNLYNCERVSPKLSELLWDTIFSDAMFFMNDSLGSRVSNLLNTPCFTDATIELLYHIDGHDPCPIFEALLPDLKENKSLLNPLFEKYGYANPHNRSRVAKEYHAIMIQ